MENLPFHKVTIDILAIHLTRDKHPNIDKYGRLIEDFLSLQSYVLRERIGGTFIFQKYYNPEDEMATNLINHLPAIEGYSGILYLWNPFVQRTLFSYFPNICVLVFIYMFVRVFIMKDIVHRN